MDEGLFAQLAATPDSVEPYLVLADQLQLRGDPRGTLIVIQRALETATGGDAADLRKREGEALLAHLGEWYPIEAEARKNITARWRWGFIHRAGANGAPALAKLLAAPHVDSTLVELHIEPNYAPNHALLVSELVAAWPHALRRLTIEGHGNHSSIVLGNPIAMPAARSPLEELCLRGKAVSFAAPPPPSLRRLEIRCPDFELASLAGFAWPALEELSIETATIDLALDEFPQLRRLALRNTANTDELVERLIAHPKFAALTHLDLYGGTLTAAGAELLRPFRDRIELELRQNLIRKAKDQRQGNAPMDRGRFARSATRACTNGPDPIARLAKATSFATAGGPLTAISDRMALARTLEPFAKLKACRELGAEIEAELRPHYGDHLRGIWQDAALACEQLDLLFDAEAAQWLVVREAHWTDRAKTVTAACSHIAELRVRRGDAAGAASLLATVQAGARDKPDRGEQAGMLRQQGNVELTRSNFVAAEQHYRNALAIYEELGQIENQGIVLSELSSAFWYRQDLDGAEQMLRQAIGMVKPGSLALASTYYNLGAILNGANRIDDSIEAATEALTLFEANTHRGGQGQALSLLGELWQRKNEPDKAIELLERAIGFERESGRRRELGITLGNLSRVALDRGDWTKARECCEEAVEIHRECSNKYNEGMQLMGLGDAAVGDNELAEADACYFDATVPLRAISNHIGLSAVHLRRGIVAQLTGKREVAMNYYRQAGAEAMRGHNEEMLGWIDMWIALLAAQVRDANPANVALNRARKEIRATSVQGCETLAMTVAVVARLLGETSNVLPEPRCWDSRIIRRLAQ